MKIRSGFVSNSSSSSYVIMGWIVADPGKYVKMLIENSLNEEDKKEALEIFEEDGMYEATQFIVDSSDLDLDFSVLHLDRKDEYMIGPSISISSEKMTPINMDYLKENAEILKVFLNLGDPILYAGTIYK